MSHFYGTVKGNRGEATRMGTKESRLTTYCASWSGAARCCAYVNSEGVDCVHVELTQWHNAGASPAILLYDGPIDGSGYKKGE